MTCREKKDINKEKPLLIPLTTSNVINRKWWNFDCEPIEWIADVFITCSKLMEMKDGGI
jgi:hypothetical protein